MSLEFSGKTKLDLKRLTALWGFSEAAFGGILHALKIPLSGIFIGGAAVIFIALIANASQNKTEILKSTLIVILVKAVVSPYSPITAYFSVLLQGTLGYLFFSSIKSEKVSTILLGFFALLFSALQKLIVLTIIFGNTFWKSLDLFIEYILNQLGFSVNNDIMSFSFAIISIYTGIHIAAGLIIGLYASELPSWLKKEYSLIDSDFIFAVTTEDYFVKKGKRKKKRWWTRPTGLIIIAFSFFIMIISYISPQYNKKTSYEILFMLIRSVVITFVWFSIISPFIIKYFAKFVEKNKFKYASEINRITELFPNFKKIINYCWKESSGLKGTKRIGRFLMNSLVLLLTIEMKNGSNQNFYRSDS